MKFYLIATITEITNLMLRLKMFLHLILFSGTFFKKNVYNFVMHIVNPFIIVGRNSM